jgi:ribosomal protein S12 methylthiotransferase accessory factor YcaO
LSDHQSVDRELNDAYQHIERSSESLWAGGTIEPSGIRDVELARLKLCNASVEFVRVAYPRLSADTVRTQITRLRLHQLQTLQR